MLSGSSGYGSSAASIGASVGNSIGPDRSCPGFAWMFPGSPEAMIGRPGILGE